MRGCGTLLHISSLPGAGGIGSMGAEARAFVDFLAESGQSWWQVLPLTPPARGNSPYSSFSVFAGNPYFISLPELESAGLLPSGTSEALPEGGSRADFDWCENVQLPLLRESFAQNEKRLKKAIAVFKDANRFWLRDYALFMAIKGENGGLPYASWENPLLMREKKALREAEKRLEREISFWEYTQYLFMNQWQALRAYANGKGIKLIGDMPIYADVESSDVWANPDSFLLDGERRPYLVAGVPPDAFSADGQLWGNPLYNWEHLKETGYTWWIERLKMANGMYDTVRIDHFRGFDSYFAIPADAVTASGGKWQKGPGMDFLRAVFKAIPGQSLIAEDLGLLTNSVRRLLKSSGLPGMKVLLFAFSTDEESDYLPHNFIKNCVGYIGTHDNSTVGGWIKSAPKDQVSYAKKYLRLSEAEGYHWGFIRGLYGTSADTVIVQAQDFLGLDDGSRINIPATSTGNWAWRMTDAQFEELDAKKIRGLAKLYGRGIKTVNKF